MQKVKRLNPYRKARLKFGRLTVRSDLNGREMIVLIRSLLLMRQNPVYSPS